MHRKGLTAALLLAALALAGCGGGGGEGSSPSAASTAASKPASPTAEAQLPEEVKEKLREAKEKALKERRAQAKEQAPSASPPHIAHRDSGGGSAQFKSRGGDNSIPDYGKEASASERDEAAESLHAYLDSLAAHRWAAACSYVSTTLAAGLERLPELAKKGTDLEGCPRILAALSSRTPQGTLDAGAEADVASLRVQGEHGFVLYRGAGGAAYAMPMVREEGVWRVGALAGAPAL